MKSYYYSIGHAIRIASGIAILALLLTGFAGVVTITLDENSSADHSGTQVVIGNDPADGLILQDTKAGKADSLPPVADAGADQTVLFGETVTFDGSGSHDADGTIVSYEWDFGDPFNTTNGTGVNPAHTYSHPDVYVVTLTVTDDSGEKGSDTMTAVIEEKIIMLELYYTKDEPLRLIDKYRKNGFAPDMVIQPPDGYRAVVSTEAGRPFYSFTFDLPNMLQYDSPEGDILTGGAIELNETNFTINIPFFNNAAWVDLYHPNGTHILRVDVVDIPDRGGSNCRTLINNGLSASLFDITFVGDNYTTAQLPQFMADVNRHQNTLLSVSPFAGRSNIINVHWVNESRNLGCQYNYTGIQRLIRCNNIAVMNLASQCPADEVIVLLNNNSYGGSGWRGAGGLSTYAVAYAGNDTGLTTNDTGDRVTVHEFGHSFGNLNDEYLIDPSSAYPGLGPNCDNIIGCPSFSGISGTCLANCTYTFWYRGDDSGGDLMLTLSNLTFGPVCTNAINTLLNQYPRTLCGGSISCKCGDFLAQDRTMVLGQDFNQTGPCPGNGLEIGTSGITLDCSGVSIPGNGIAGFTGIMNTIFNNVTMKNCMVSNYFNGIHVMYASNNTIFNNTVSSSALIPGSNGIWIETSSRNNVTGNAISSYDWGIVVELNSSFNIVEKNNVSSDLRGLYLYNSFNNIINNNNVSSNNDGISEINGIFNTIAGNIVQNNSFRGIFLQSSNNDTLDKNNISANFVGITVDQSANNTIYNNYFNNSNNVVFNNPNFNNTWNTTRTFMTNIIGGPRIVGNYWADPFGTGFSETCPDMNQDGICDLNFIVSSLFNIDYLPLSPNFMNRTITVGPSGSDFTSIQEAINAAQNGFTIYVMGGAYTENVDVNRTVNLIGAGQGNTVVSPANPDDHIFNVTVNNVTINGFTINGSASAGYAGIFADNVNLTNISDNYISGYMGIHLNSSSDIGIFNNTIESNFVGIYLRNSNYNVMKKNNISKNAFGGVRIYFSNNNSLSDNFIFNNSHGIFLSDSSINNNMTNNAVEQSSIHDIYINVECNNILANNTGSGNLPIKYFNSAVNLQNEVLSELILCDADNSMIDNVTLIGSGLVASMTDDSIFRELNSSNNHYGIYLWISENITIENSSMNSNTIGIHAYGVNNSNISSNTLGNSFQGIFFPLSSGNMIKNNMFTGNDFGITSVDSNFNTFVNNNISSSNDTGIQVVSSNNNTLTNNTLADNPKGVHLRISGGNRLNDNRLYRNNEGIALSENSRYNILSGNIIAMSGNFALYLDMSDNNTLDNNIIQNSNSGLRISNSSLTRVMDNMVLNNSRGIELTVTTVTTANQNVVCANTICDFNLTSAQPNEGTNNTCDLPDGWNDRGITGCSFGCTSAYVNTSTGMGQAYFRPGSGTMQNIMAINASLLPPAPNVSFPYGLFSFIIDGLSPGQSVTLTIIYPENVPVTSGYWKYGPTPDNLNPHWYQVPQGSNDGDNIITITLSDGGPGDDDMNANGIIDDDGGEGIFIPDASPPASVSNLHNVSYAPDYIKWTWTDPSDEDFFKVIVYLDGIYKSDVLKGEQHYNASVTPGTYTIGTRTVDASGNINTTMVTHTATTVLPSVRYINGTVRDKNDPLAPLPNAIVFTDTGVSTTTNETGFYSLAVMSGTYDITATYEPTHYANSSITVSTELSAVVVQDIELSGKPTGNIGGSVKNI